MSTKKKTPVKPVSQNLALFCFVEKAFAEFYPEKIEVLDTSKTPPVVVKRLDYKYKPASRGQDGVGRQPSREEIVVMVNKLLHDLRRAGVQQTSALVYDFRQSDSALARFDIDISKQDVLAVSDPKTWMLTPVVKGLKGCPESSPWNDTELRKNGFRGSLAYGCVGCRLLLGKRPVGLCMRCGSCDNTIPVHVSNFDGETPEKIAFTALCDIDTEEDTISYIPTGIAGFDHVLGGGLVPGSVVLLTGDPGIGKTTLILQACQKLSKQHRVLYVTEETVRCLRKRAERLGKTHANLLVGRERELDSIIEAAAYHNAKVLVVDSIQVLRLFHPQTGEELEVGSPKALKCALQQLNTFAQQSDVAIVAVGHITKGNILGPRTFEHEVDIAIYLSTENYSNRKLSCPYKNRDAEVPRTAMFEITKQGFRNVERL